MIFGINTTCDISKLSQIVSISVSKYHSWYLCQISLQIMQLPILTSKLHFTVSNKTATQTQKHEIRDSQTHHVCCVFVGQDYCIVLSEDDWIKAPTTNSSQSALEDVCDIRTGLNSTG